MALEPMSTGYVRTACPRSRSRSSLRSFSTTTAGRPLARDHATVSAIQRFQVRTCSADV